MIDKITFCDVLEKLRTQMYLDKKNGDAIQEMFGCGSRCSYNDNLLVQAIMSLLHIHFPKDVDGFSRLEHYVFFCEFGKFDSKELLEVGDLYDILVIESNK